MLRLTHWKSFESWKSVLINVLRKQQQQQQQQPQRLCDTRRLEVLRRYGNLPGTV